MVIEVVLGGLERTRLPGDLLPTHTNGILQSTTFVLSKPHASTMPKLSQTTEPVIERNYHPYFDLDKSPIRRLAREFGLVGQADHNAYSVSSRVASLTQRENSLNKTLDSSQEHALEKWIRKTDYMSRPAC